MSAPLPPLDANPPAPPPAAGKRRFFRRQACERTSMALIAAGAFMLMQPFSIELFSYSFVVLLAGVVGYSIAGKLPV